jgi:hypothetical protein
MGCATPIPTGFPTSASTTRSNSCRGTVCDERATL